MQGEDHCPTLAPAAWILSATRAPHRHVFPATLFDFNGVLVDDESVHLAAFRDAVEPLGIAISEHDYVERYLGFDDRGAFRAILADNGRAAPEEEIHRLIERKKPLYEVRAKQHLPTFPGAAELVRRAAAHGPVAVVSGALRSEIALGLEVLGVSDVVEHIVAAEDTRACKPDPEGYRLGIEYLKGRIGAGGAARALVLEDSKAGVEAAKAAGLFCAAVTHSYPAVELQLAGADLIVARLDELTDERLAEAFRSFHA